MEMAVLDNPVRIKGPNVFSRSSVPEGRFQTPHQALAADRKSFGRSLLRMKRAVFLGAGLLLVGRIPAGAAEPRWPTITDPGSIWAMPTDEKSQAHPLRLEGRVSYYDAEYGLFWIERD